MIQDYWVCGCGRGAFKREACDKSLTERENDTCKELKKYQCRWVTKNIEIMMETRIE